MNHFKIFGMSAHMDVRMEPLVFAHSMLIKDIFNVIHVQKDGL